jgi:hypothetical protein
LRTDRYFRYAVLFGQAPDFADDQIQGTEGGTAYFNKRITQLLKRDQFAKGKQQTDMVSS